MQPLAGIKILDFTTLLPGPYATHLLAEMGADVLRIESPTRPDLLKVMPPYVGKVSAAHAMINRNKRSLALDLKHNRAQEIVHRLLASYDIVVEGFRPGVMARLGLDYETLKAVKPSLIYCSITGYGQTGPLKDRAGHDINYLALSGLASFSGEEETGPVLSGLQIADIAGGSHHAVMAIQAAIIHRMRSGEGQYLDISMADAALSLTGMYAANQMVSGHDPECGKEALNGGTFYGYYKTSDGRYLSIGSLEPQFAQGLLTCLGLSEWGSKASNPQAAIQKQIRALLADKISSNTLKHWQDFFADKDFCVEPVLKLGEALKHPHFVERQLTTQTVSNNGAAIPQINTALPFAKNQEKHIGGITGQDSQQVLLDLGLDEDEIKGLIDAKCVACGKM